MRIPTLLCIAASLAMPVSAAEPGLAGDWVVDLATDPAVPYTQPMKLVLHPDGGVEGSFYDSRIEAGRWKSDRGRVCASFRTSDGVGPYHTSVCLEGDVARGQTWAEHRSVLFNWNAARAPAAGKLDTDGDRNAGEEEAGRGRSGPLDALPSVLRRQRGDARLHRRIATCVKAFPCVQH